MTKSKIIFDIETVGDEFESLDATSQASLLKYAKTDEEKAQVRDSLGFYPLTAKVVTIAMLEEATAQSFVYYLKPGEQPTKLTEANAQYLALSNESQLLECFWRKVKEYSQFITFNGRSFDCPFLLIRSAINRIKPSRNLMPDRYRSNAHIDLMEKLTFLGASRRRFSLHMWCLAFGIDSPKEDGVDGSEVKGLFDNRRYLDIARYCLRDVVATKELFGYWQKYINISD